MPCNTLLPYRSYYVGSSSTDQGVTPEYLSWNDPKDGTLSITGNLRAKTNFFNTHYYRYLQLYWGHGRNYYGVSYYMGSTAAYLDLKDPSIFPAQPLTNITVGVGDGITKDFACPLNYFQEGTAKLFKNGVELIANVDYTIEHDANKDKLPELMHIIYPDDVPIKITSDPSIFGKRGSYLQFAADPSQRNNLATWDPSQVCTEFTHEHPLLFDWGAPRKCNCLQGTLYTYYAGALYIDYSEDGETWQEITSVNISNNSGVSTPIELSWDPITARYWRIRITSYGPYTDSYPTYAYFYGNAYLGYSNPYGIHFTEAPAEGDILTMECFTDIPLKNSTFAFNLALDLNISYN
jgi:hypothetical protein